MKLLLSLQSLSPSPGYASNKSCSLSLKTGVLAQTVVRKALNNRPSQTPNMLRCLDARLCLSTNYQQPDFETHDNRKRSEDTRSLDSSDNTQMFAIRTECLYVLLQSPYQAEHIRYCVRDPHIPYVLEPQQTSRMQWSFKCFIVLRTFTVNRTLLKIVMTSAIKCRPGSHPMMCA